MHERTPLHVRLVARPAFRERTGPFLCTAHNMYGMTGVSTPPFGRKGSCSSTGLLCSHGDALGDLTVGEREVACRHVAARLLVEQRLLDRAHLLALPAASVEAAGGRRVGRARHVAAEDLPRALHSRV